MPDISLCSQAFVDKPLCKFAKKCYRATAEPTPHWQSVADFFPYKIKDCGKDKCLYFMDVKYCDVESLNKTVSKKRRK